MNPLQQAIYNRTCEVARRYRRDEAELLEMLQKVEDKKVFVALGYTSLFQFACRELNLSEGIAYSLIAVGRKAVEIPAIAAEIKSGNLTVSKAHKIVSVVDSSNATQWIEKAKTLPRLQLEREVAKTNPEVLTPERAKYVAEKRFALSLGVSEDLYEKLSRIKDILSQKSNQAASLEDALTAMAELYLQKNDPVVKAERILAKKAPVTTSPESSTANKQFPGSVEAEHRKALPAWAKHAVFHRDQGQCSAILPDGSRCQSKRWLHIHHVIFRSLGGTDGPENMQLLCFRHHQALHEATRH